MSRNDVTGDKIQTKSPSAAFDEGFDRIFGKKPPKGYTAEELERDNPHNQWMYENAEPTNTDPSSKR